MAELLPTIVPYIPTTLVRTLLAKPQIPTKPVVGRSPAAALIADISGFTPLTEALSQKGAEGPEELTRLLNRYFSRMIALTEAEGGEVIQFGGDAVTVIFPAKTESGLALGLATRRAFQAAEAMQAAMTEFATMSTSVGPVTLEMKIGIGAGEVLTMQLGGVANRWAYIVGGDLLRQSAKAEGQAQRGEIVLSPEAAATIHPDPLSPQALIPPDWTSVANPAAVETRLRHFVPEVVLGWLEEGLREWLGLLRPMSVLFVGVEGLDYDQADAVNRLHSFLQRAQETVARYEGSINKLSVDDKGTLLLLLFGAPPYAHEDDPLRAVRCALDLQSLTAAEPPETALHLSIGIASGHVFAGPVGSENRREYTVVGDTVNLAARLMAAARTSARPGATIGRGGILSDFDTYNQVHGQIAFESLAPVRVKGKAGLIRVYQPTESAVGNLPPMVREQGPLVGRESELARLEAALETVKAGKSRVLILSGEAGIGKSRLVLKLTSILRERGLAWLLGAGQNIEQRTPYRAWRDIFSYYFGLSQANRPAEQQTLIERQECVRSLMREVAPDQLERLPLLNDILSLGLPETELTASLDPALRQQNLFLLLVTLLRAWAHDHPLILVLEDAHWLDSLSWELALYVARALIASGDPLLLVLVTRPLDKHSVGAQHTAVLEPLETTETIVLDTLYPKEIVALVTNRLGLPKEGLPEPIAELVRQRSGGNPFFAEELVFALRDQGIIRIEADPKRCVIVGDLTLASQTLPGTIQGLILARIDRLPPERQLTLKLASVIGRTFSYDALYHTLNRHTTVSDAVLKTHLDALASLGLTPLYTPEPEPIYIFRHIITQDVAYETLLFAQRRQLHRTVAEWYESTYGGDHEKEIAPSLAPHLPLLAHHYHQAQDPARERRYARLAGEQAAVRFANTDAVAYLSRALELTPKEDAAERYRLLSAREKVYDLQGVRAAQSQDLLALKETVEILDDDQKRAEVLLAQARYEESTGNLDAAIAAAREAIALACQEDMVSLEAAGYLHWGRTLWRQGNYQESQIRLERVLEFALADQLRKLEADSLRNLGIVSAEQGDGPGAKSHFEQALSISQEIGDRRGESAALNNLGIISHRIGDNTGFASYSEQALRAYQEIGDRRGQGLALNNQGVASERQGHYVQARGHYEEALCIFREIGDPMGEGAALNNLGIVSHQLGDYAGARTYLEPALRIYHEIGDRQGEAESLAYLGLLSQHLDDDESARTYSLQALQIAEEIGDGSSQGRALTCLGHALAGLGQLDQAAEAYRQAVQIRRELGEHHLALESLAALSRVTMAQGESAQALAQVKEILACLETSTLDGTDEPFRVYLSCYRVLQANQDPQAREILAVAHSLLQTRAANIPDEQIRRSFLENPKSHRDIIELWEKK